MYSCRMLSSSLRRGALALLLLIFLFVPSLCRAGLAPRLVRDIDETSYAGSSSPRQFGGVEHGMAFTAFGGRELWLYDERSDLRRVLKRKEIRQLQGPFYAALEPRGGWSFWLAVGSPYDTVFPISRKLKRLGAIYQGEWWDGPGLFEADTGGERGLWTVNYGTGPVEVARPLPLEDGHLLRDWTPGRGRGYFIARHRTLGTALWKTDGTAAGTLAVAAPSPGRTVPLWLAGALRGRLLLAISGGEPELWWSDGTKRGGLRPFTEIVPGLGAAMVSAARVVSGRAFLVVDDGRQGRQLWTSDGTAAGTIPVTSFARDPLREIGIPLLRKGRRWYFVADDGFHGRELWRTDGTRQGTQLAIDLCPGPCSSDPQDLSVRDYGDPSGILFTASAPGGPRALWQTDGTPQETSRVTPPGVEATTGIQYADYFENFFAARTADLGEELWVTGGTPETTKLWVDLGLKEDSGSHPSLIGAAGDRLFFQTHAPAVGYGLWTSDGTTAGTSRIPAPPGLRIGEPYSFSATSLGERMLFMGSTFAPDGSSALWSTGGTTAGFSRLTPPGVAVQSTPLVIETGTGARAVFSATDAEHGSELWVTAGTPASTHLVVDLVPGPAPGAILDRVPLLRGQLLFRGWSSSELWLTDGTAEGTRRLVDVYPFLAPLERSGGLSFAEAGGKLFFLGAAEAGGEAHLWVSDGTAAGTAPLAFADSAGYIEALFPAAGHLYFAVADDHAPSPFSGSYLWITDGTPAGTVRTPARPIISYYDDAMRPVSFGDRLLYVNNGFHFAVTDGTAEGTFPLLDPRGDEIHDLDGRAIDFKNHLVFATGYDDGEDGACYVWNGAGAAVQQLENLACDSFLAAGDRLYFRGFQPQTGAELWVMEEQ
jgi:ELWxxDGT repeat protein